MSNINFLAIFDGLLLAFGIYMIFAALRMKKTGVISNLLVHETELQRMKDKKGFIEEISGKMLVFAGIMALYGAFGLVDDLIFEIPMGQIIGVMIFFVSMIWFFRALMKAKSKYMM